MNSMTIATSPEVAAMTGGGFAMAGPPAASASRITARLWGDVSEQPTTPSREIAHHIQEVVR